jgi:hypothetical protein
VSVEVNQVNIIRAEDEDLYELLEETHEEVGEALVDIDIVQCGLNGIYRTLGIPVLQRDYTREKVGKVLDTLESLDYLREYSKGVRKEYEAKHFTEDDLQDLKREVIASGRKDSYQMPLPSEEDIVPGVDEIS